MMGIGLPQFATKDDEVQYWMALAHQTYKM